MPRIVSNLFFALDLLPKYLDTWIRKKGHPMTGKRKRPINRFWPSSPSVVECPCAMHFFDQIKATNVKEKKEKKHAIENDEASCLELAFNSRGRRKYLNVARKRMTNDNDEAERSGSVGVAQAETVIKGQGLLGKLVQ